MDKVQNFSQLDTSSLVDKVENMLVKLLQDRKLKVGDSIPTELELCAALGVSRTVVREAMLRLRMMGLIESKKKKGAVITSPDILQVLSKSMNPHILDKETLKEIFGLRLVLEIGMADFLFQRITKDDILELRALVHMEPEHANDYLFEIDHEIKFHSKLYDITGNETLKKFQKLLLPIFDFVHTNEILKKPTHFSRFVSHKQLIDILETGTPELFRNAMRGHLENHFVRVFQD